jgi:hypothetical protein
MGLNDTEHRNLTEISLRNPTLTEPSRSRCAGKIGSAENRAGQSFRVPLASPAEHKGASRRNACFSDTPGSLLSPRAS